MLVFDLEALESTALTREPFSFVVVPRFILPSAFDSITRDFPSLPGPGSFPPESLKIGQGFQPLLDELESPAFRRVIERKFEMSLAERPHLTTIRGYTRARDGGAHTDSESKLVTVLLYLNDSWPHDGGRLRLLRSSKPDDAVVEILPVAGTLVAFQRSASSWHGHAAYEGPRHVVQFNWLTENKIAAREHRRHFAAAYFKKLSRFFSPAVRSRASDPKVGTGFGKIRCV